MKKNNKKLRKAMNHKGTEYKTGINKTSHVNYDNKYN